MFSSFPQQVGLDTQDPFQVGVILVVGVLLQLYGARLLVQGGAGLARRLGIPSLVIGATVVAFGVSTPDLFVSVWAAGKGLGDIATGSAVGGVLLNLGLILGISCVGRPLRFRPQLFQADVPILVASAALVGFLMRNGALGRFEACLLLFCLMGYLLFLWLSAGVEADTRVIEEMERDLPKPGGAKRVELAQLAGGIVLLITGSRYLVKSAITGAEMLHLSQPVLALGLIPLAASSPQIVSLVLALWNGEKDLAGGVIVGSCLFHLLGVLGVAALYRPIFAPHVSVFDFGLMLIGTLAVLPMMRAGKKGRRILGVLLLAGYGMYWVHLFGRGVAGQL